MPGGGANAAYVRVHVRAAEQHFSCASASTPAGSRRRSSSLFLPLFCLFCFSFFFSPSLAAAAAAVEGLKMITNTVHFISMRTKTARGTHYHFTEEDREPSARLFTPPPPPLGHFPPSPSHEGAVLLLLLFGFFFPFHFFSFFFSHPPASGSSRAGRGAGRKAGRGKKKHRLINK